MKIYELAVSSHLADGIMGDFGESYANFRKAVGGLPDLLRPEHGQALLVWLNKWGCRQFARAHHDVARAQIAEWFTEHKRSLPPEDVDLWDATDRELQDAAHAYGQLTERTASYRNGGPIRVGPTGAAKILFALRPRLLPPWDDPIRKDFNCDGSADSYARFVKDAVAECTGLAQESQQHGFHLSELPGRLGQPDATMPKLMDEYYWITITRGVSIPTPETVTGWLAWANK